VSTLKGKKVMRIESLKDPKKPKLIEPSFRVLKSLGPKEKPNKLSLFCDNVDTNFDSELYSIPI
jgi:hypothetical protein